MADDRGKKSKVRVRISFGVIPHYAQRKNIFLSIVNVSFSSNIFPIGRSYHAFSLRGIVNRGMADEGDGSALGEFDGINFTLWRTQPDKEPI